MDKSEATELLFELKTSFEAAPMLIVTLPEVPLLPLPAPHCFHSYQ